MRKAESALDEHGVVTDLSELDEQITDQEHDVVNRHGNLVRMLGALPADELLGLSLGVLAGTAQRHEAASMASGAHDDAGWKDADSPLLQAWLLRVLSSAGGPGGVVRGLAAFRVGKECSQRPGDDSRHAVSDSVALDVLGSVTKTISEAAEHARCLGEDDDAHEPPELKALRASLLDDDGLEGFVELTAGHSGIRRMECIAELTRRKPPFALVTILQAVEPLGDLAKELADPGNNPMVALLHEDFVEGLSAVRQGERVRLRLESALAGRVLTTGEVDEPPRPLSSARSAKIGRSPE